MIELAQVTGFHWDDGNSRKSTQKHNVIQSEAEQIFFNQPLLLLDDIEHSQTEARYHALGKTDDGRQLHVTFTLRVKGTLIRVISARDMNRRERTKYEQSQN
ncbi:MAG: BrnT family toxin [Gammaproteobacteria bacterium]|nr:MAG: BrnT family toxin [Gammaproteobacteria bacterium]